MEGMKLTLSLRCGGEMRFLKTIKRALAGSLVVSIVGLPILFYAESANAVSITSSGTWQNATTVGSNPNLNGEGTNLLSWGDSVTNPGQQSSFEFIGVSGVDIGNALDGLSFQVAGLWHTNWDLDASSGWITDVDLSFTIDFNGDSSGILTIPWNHLETGGIGVGDDVTILANSNQITIGGLVYDFSMIGFRQSILDPITSEVTTAEQTRAFYQVWGQLTLVSEPPDGGEPPTVPEPSSMLLLGMGLGALGLVASRRKKT